MKVNYSFPIVGTVEAPAGTVVDHVQVDLTYGTGTVLTSQAKPVSNPVAGTFTNVNSGDYTVKAQQVTADGTPVGPVQSFDISVLPNVNVPALGSGSGTVGA